MNENGDCVASASCSCYDSGKIIPAGISISKDGGSWYGHGVGYISVEQGIFCIQGFSKFLMSRTPQNPQALMKI